MQALWWGSLPGHVILHHWNGASHCADIIHQCDLLPVIVRHERPRHEMLVSSQERHLSISLCQQCSLGGVSIFHPCCTLLFTYLFYLSHLNVFLTPSWVASVMPVSLVTYVMKSPINQNVNRISIFFVHIVLSWLVYVVWKNNP